MLVNATNMLLKARDGHYGVGQFNINNLEWTRSISASGSGHAEPGYPGAFPRVPANI